MAKSIQTYHDRENRFDDVDLLIIMSMMIYFINEHRHEASYACLMESAAHWERQIVGYGPGIIDLELEETLREKIVYDAFVSVLREIRARLELFGERVPLDFIHELVMFSIFAEDKEPRIQITKPQRVEELLKVVENLEELIVT